MIDAPESSVDTADAPILSDAGAQRCMAAYDTSILRVCSRRGALYVVVRVKEAVRWDIKVIHRNQAAQRSCKPGVWYLFTCCSCAIECMRVSRLLAGFCVAQHTIAFKAWLITVDSESSEPLPKTFRIRASVSCAHVYCIYTSVSAVCCCY